MPTKVNCLLEPSAKVVHKFETWDEADVFRKKIGVDSITEQYMIDKKAQKITKITYLVKEELQNA
tara:strand:- start:233 stop:427 length:195 start_codon:yes stop_codon:yes gene_type:complete